MIRPVTCPICQKVLVPVEGAMPATHPFCSARCRQVDFFRWFDGKYALVEPIDPETGDPELLDGPAPRPLG